MVTFSDNAALLTSLGTLITIERTCSLAMVITSCLYCGVSGGIGLKTLDTGTCTVRSLSLPLDCMLGIVISAKSGWRSSLAQNLMDAPRDKLQE